MNFYTESPIMKKHIFLLTIFPAVMMLYACSSTVVTGSWKSPDFSGKIKKVYILGIAKQESTRRIFEDEFRRQLATYSVTGLPSYHDLPVDTKINQDAIAEKVKQKGADSVLMARAVGKRTEQVVNPGYISRPGYNSGYAGAGYSPDPYYRNYGSYYARSYDVVYQPATVSEFEIVTVEANLYNAASGQLIWSAQLETVVENNLGKLIVDFVATVTKDLKDKNLL